MEETGRLQSMGSLRQTRLSDFTFTFHFHALEKDKATHSSVLAWRIPGTGEPGGLPSVGSHRGGHDWSGLAAAAACYKCAFMALVFECSVVSVWVWTSHTLWAPYLEIQESGHCVPSHVWVFAAPWTVACQAPLFMGLIDKNTGVVAMPSSRGSSRGLNPRPPH